MTPTIAQPPTSTTLSNTSATRTVGLRQPASALIHKSRAPKISFGGQLEYRQLDYSNWPRRFDTITRESRPPQPLTPLKLHSRQLPQPRSYRPPLTHIPNCHRLSPDRHQSPSYSHNHHHLPTPNSGPQVETYTMKETNTTGIPFIDVYHVTTETHAQPIRQQT